MRTAVSFLCALPAVILCAAFAVALKIGGDR